MNDKYDAVIIGSGIGGLICGCYLSKKGIKTLIIEQHDKPGGYCGSFERKGYIFDVGVSYLGSLYHSGLLFNIFKELGILNRIKILTNDPTDRIVTPDRTIFIREKIIDTQNEFISHFHREKESIKRFFSFICNPNLLSIVYKIKRLTFAAFLDKFFSDKKLKAIFSILLGNFGLPPSKASALVGVVTYREFILCGGYYPQGGMQVVPNVLSERLREYGGKVMLSTKATKIVTNNGRVVGVITDKDGLIKTDILVSNADVSLTFKKLLDYKTIEIKKMEGLQTSSSAFVIYLGLNKELAVRPKHYITWFFTAYDIEECYRKQDLIDRNNIKYIICCFLSLIDPTLAPQNKSNVRILVKAEYKNKRYWEVNRERIYNNIMKKVELLIPGIKKNIEEKIIATPYDFYKYTANSNGALFGWKATPQQIGREIFPYRTSIDNFYITGHWVTNGTGHSGIPSVAFWGKYTALKILKKVGFH